MIRHPNTIYRGERLSGPAGQVLGTVVTRDGFVLALAPSNKLRNHSATGFEWGYGGSGPAQLALAILLDATGDARLSLAAYQWFKWAVVSQWGQRWEISAAGVQEWVARWRREGRQPDLKIHVPDEPAEDTADVPHVVTADAADAAHVVTEGGAA